MRRALWAVLEGVPDRREASGRRYPLPAILAITVAAMLAGRTSLAAIARWGRQLDREALRALGIMRPRAPCHSTYHYVFRDLDVDALEAGLAAWVRGAGAAAELGDLNHVALDGKRLRGSRTAEGPGVHLLAAFCRSLRGVIGQLRVAPDASEITAALELLKGLPLEGLLVTGDAEFTQREICHTIVDRGGDYFFVVKDNQPRLREDIALLFAAPPEAGAAPPRDARR
ncbi:MAG TPA: ISAs1 family transposase [Geminicoccaceae bacterium]|nr:ISAs1 family transposase [Geminicoccaceae bacterium]